VDGVVNALDGALRGFRAAGKPTDTVGHSIKVERLVTEEAVFIITAKFSDVGKCGTA
jgi:hypothetical protein